MKSQPIHYVLAATLALGALPAAAQEERKPAPPTPPESTEPAQSPRRPPATPPDIRMRREPPPGSRSELPRPPEGGRRLEESGRRPEESPRRDGDRKPDGDGGHERRWHIPLPPPPPPVPTPYVGVVTLPPPPALSAQLGLKEGFGLVVSEVLPDSPAVTAGLQKHDVLTKFNDQQLVDAEQFATLVRAAGKDADATLTLLRATKELTVPVKIGERLAPQRRPLPGGAELREQFERWKGPAQDSWRKMQERMKDYTEKMREYQERLKGWQKNPSADLPPPPAPPVLEPDNAGLPIHPADILVGRPPGDAPHLRMLQRNGAVSYNTAEAKMVMKDDTGEIEVRTKDGQRVLVAKNAQGETTFDGPIDTEEQRKALPEDIRRKVEMMQVRATASVAEPPAFVPPADNIQ